MFLDAASVANTPGVQQSLELPDAEHQPGVDLLIGRQSLQMPVTESQGQRSLQDAKHKKGTCSPDEKVDDPRH